MDTCWAVLVGLDAPVDQDFTIARPEDGPLAWVARNSSKPARRGGEAWVLHARHDWSVAHLEETPEDMPGACLTYTPPGSSDRACRSPT
jgi:predicted NAD/FAD-dependent oxidoreductase